LNAEQINELCDEAERIFRDEATVLQLQGAEKRREQARGWGRGAAFLEVVGLALPFTACALMLRGA